MTIEQIDISQVQPAVYNPRVISEDEMDGLVSSLRKFGFVEPLIINKRTNNLVGGHQRLKAADLLGLTTVPVTYVDLSEIEEKALNIALNSHTIQGKYDHEILPTLLEEIKLEMPDLSKELRLDQLERDLKLVFDPVDSYQEKEVDENISLKNDCPSCGYKW